VGAGAGAEGGGGGGAKVRGARPERVAPLVARVEKGAGCSRKRKKRLKGIKIVSKEVRKMRWSEEKEKRRTNGRSRRRRRGSISSSGIERLVSPSEEEFPVGEMKSCWDFVGWSRESRGGDDACFAERRDEETE